MTVLEAITFLRAHGLRVRWTPTGTLNPAALVAVIGLLSKQPRGQA